MKFISMNLDNSYLTKVRHNKNYAQQTYNVPIANKRCAESKASLDDVLGIP